jgi:pimeloyl-ACP methyl ester carboxylesterase
MLQGKNIIIQGLNIRYYQSADFDKNQALVFLHGWGSQSLHFRKTLEQCENALAIDLPGFGQSELPHQAWTLDDYADFVRDFLEKTGIQNPIIAGHSLGGSIGIKYCARKNSVRKLIIIGGAGLRRKTAKKYFFYAIAKAFRLLFFLPGISALKNSVRKWFYRTIDSEDYINAGALGQTYQNIIREDLGEDLKKIDSPTVLIWGENDQDTPLEDGRMMRRLIRNSQLHIIEDAGHYVFLDNGKAFDKIFLEQIR